MWVLCDVKEDSDADITFSDKSISRKHASIIVDPVEHEHMGNIEFRPRVVLKDVGSKYGTKANGKSIKDPTVIENDTVMEFGTLDSAVKLVWKHLFVCRTSLGRNEKEELLEAGARLGFHITKDWDDNCTHLYVKEIRFTHKLIQCLVQLKPVVSTSWLAEFVSDTSTVFPDFEKHIPPLSSDFPLTQCAPNFLPSVNRTWIFNGLIFYIFGKEQFDRLSTVIKAAGGKAIFCRPGTPLRSPLIQSNKGVFVIPTSGIDNNSWTGVEKSLRKAKREAIKEEAIGWSIVHCSLEKIGDQSILAQPVEPKPFGENQRKGKASTLEEKLEYVPAVTSKKTRTPTSPLETPSESPVTFSGTTEAHMDMDVDQDLNISAENSKNIGLSSEQQNINLYIDSPSSVEPKTFVKNQRKRKASTLEEKSKYVPAATSEKAHTPTSPLGTSSESPVTLSEAQEAHMNMDVYQDYEISTESSENHNLSSEQQNINLNVNRLSSTGKIFEKCYISETSVLPQSYIKDCLPAPNAKIFKKGFSLPPVSSPTYVPLNNVKNKTKLDTPDKETTDSFVDISIIPTRLDSKRKRDT
ncbi:hypothetical protein F4703DRAFT_1935280 [Phycomyces blakesleeanus]